jgi:glutathione S-transferase
MSNENTLQLFMSARSPFARRVRLALKRQNREWKEIPLDVFQNNPDLEKFNPQGAVPTLVLADGSALSDSSNILEFLGAFPDDFKIRQAAQIAEGIIQSSVLYFQEKHLHEVPSERWLKEHVKCMEDSFSYLAKMPTELFLREGALTQAGWDLAVAIEYVGLRAPEIEVGGRYPNLTECLEVARQDHFFASTKPVA